MTVDPAPQHPARATTLLDQADAEPAVLGDVVFSCGRDASTGALTDYSPADLLMAADSDLTRAQAQFLADDDYASIDEWAEDSDYYYENLSGEWYSHDAPAGWPGPPPVDIYGALDGAMESALSERGDTVFDMDAIVTALKSRYQIPAYVEQTGGGCATIYAGEAVQICEVEGEPHYNQYPVLAGPGWFEGPGFTNPRATTAEFYIGTYDSDDDDGYVTLADEFDDGSGTDLLTIITDLIAKAIKEATA